MNMIKMARCWPVLLAIMGMVAINTSPARAANEVTSVKLEPAVMSDQFVKLAEPLIVSWTAPSAGSVMNYILKFNTSSAALTDADFNDTSGKYDFLVDPLVTTQSVPQSFFTNYDSNQFAYLHIKTLYVPGTYSSDVVVGPIRIDNVAPTGSISLDPTSGSSTQITVTLSSSTDTQYYWLSNSSTMPLDSLKQTYTSPYQATGSFFPAYPDTAYGNVKIYAWFKDFAGNVSTAPTAQADYTYTAPVSIQYNATSVAVNGTLAFTVDSSTHYNWEITPSADGVAFVQGTTSLTVNDAASLTVEGKAVGTFTVKATPTAGGSALPVTGTITVTQSYTLGDVNADGSIDSGDAILVLRYSVGLTTLTDTQKAAGNVTSKTSNNDIDSGDAIKILRYSVGLITAL